MIIDLKSEEFSKLKKACQIAAKALEYAKSLVKPGKRVVDVCDAIEEFIIKEGCELAFPVQISLNDVAAHFCPLGDNELEFNDQVVKIDIGVHVDGYIGDNAATVDLSKENNELVKATVEALKEAIKLARPGVKVCELGRAIHDAIVKYGFSPVVNLTGHGLDKYNIHSKPIIPNYDNNDETALEENQLIAIEPFASTGAGIVYESSPPTIFALKQKKPVRLGFVRNILREIEKRKGLPFTTRWLTKKFPKHQVNFALAQLLKEKIIESFPPLVDKEHGLVSQAEHTILVKDKPIILTRV